MSVLLPMPTKLISELTKQGFWSYLGLVVVLMIYLPDYWDAQSLQGTLYMSVMGTVAYRAFYACFCLQVPLPTSCVLLCALVHSCLV